MLPWNEQLDASGGLRVPGGPPRWAMDVNGVIINRGQQWTAWSIASKLFTSSRRCMRFFFNWGFSKEWLSLVWMRLNCVGWDDGQVSAIDPVGLSTPHHIVRSRRCSQPDRIVDFVWEDTLQLRICVQTSGQRASYLLCLGLWASERTRNFTNSFLFVLFFILKKKTVSDALFTFSTMATAGLYGHIGVRRITRVNICSRSHVTIHTCNPLSFPPFAPFTHEDNCGFFCLCSLWGTENHLLLGLELNQ